MKNKSQERQMVIQEILGTYGGVDDLDIRCLAVRFKVDAEVVTGDVRKASEALERQRLEQERVVELERERAAELAVARRILKRGTA
jgi:hypothetical protein